MDLSGLGRLGSSSRFESQPDHDVKHGSLREVPKLHDEPLYPEVSGFEEEGFIASGLSEAESVLSKDDSDISDSNYPFVKTMPLNEQIAEQLERFDNMLPYLKKFITRLENSSKERDRSYARLLSFIIYKIPTIHEFSVGTDTPDKIVFHYSDVWVFDDGHMAFDFNKYLRDEEIRPLVKGNFVTPLELEDRVDVYREHVRLGDGRNGFVCKAISITKLLDFFEVLQKDLPSFDNIPYDDILKRLVKTAVRQSLVAMKSSSDKAPPLNSEVNDALLDSDKVILPITFSDERSIYELGISDMHYFFQELENKDYKIPEFLKKHIPFKTYGQVCHMLFIHALEGLKDMHDRGVYHRDIKPENIVLTDEGIKFIDFEKSILASQIPEFQLTQDMNLLLGGTLATSPPEVIRLISSHTTPSERKDYLMTLDETWFEKVDIYSLGVVFAQHFVDQELQFSSPLNRDVFSADLTPLIAAIYETPLPDFQQNMLVRMISLDPSERPTVDEVLEAFSVYDYDSDVDDSLSESHSEPESSTSD